MDPIIATVIWGVVWFFLIGIFSWLGIVAGASLGALLAVLFDADWIGVGVAILGWIVGIGLSIWAIVQVILHIVDLLRETGIIHG